MVRILQKAITFLTSAYLQFLPFSFIVFWLNEVSWAQRLIEDDLQKEAPLLLSLSEHTSPSKKEFFKNKMKNHKCLKDPFSPSPLTLLVVAGEVCVDFIAFLFFPSDSEAVSNQQPTVQVVFEETGVQDKGIKLHKPSLEYL